VKIPESLSGDKSAALASFADLLTNLIEVRGRAGRPGGTVPERYNGNIGIFNLDLVSLRTGQLITIGMKLFRLFHVPEILNCDDRALASWMGKGAALMANTGTFLSMVHALNFAYAVCSSVGWLDQFSYSEQAAMALAVFLGHSFPQIHPNFRYEKLLSRCISVDTPQRAVTKISTMLVLLGDDYCDLLATTPESLIVGLIELWIHANSMVNGRSASYFHAIHRGLDMKDMFHRTVVRRFVEESSLCSLFLSPLSAFSQWVARYVTQPLDCLIRKGKGVVTDIVRDLADYHSSCGCLTDFLKDVLKYLADQTVRVPPGPMKDNMEIETVNLLPLSASRR
jgi:hypothetical protein